MSLIKKTIALCFLALGIPYFAFSQSITPEEYLEFVLEDHHPPGHMDPEGPLPEVKTNPTPYLDVIEAWLVFPSDTEFHVYEDDDMIVRYTKLFHILSIVATERARSILENAYYLVAGDMNILEAEFEASLANGGTEEEQKTMMSQLSGIGGIFNELVYNFTLLEDDRILNDALNRVSALSTTKQGGILEYNEKAGSQEIVSELDVFEQRGSWSLKGLPLQPLVTNFDEIYNDVGLSQEPVHWNGTQYVFEADLSVGKGYWMQPEFGIREHIIGQVVTSFTLELQEGWNLISPPNCAPNDFHRYQISDENNMTFFKLEVYGYGKNGYYLAGDYMSAGEGYWIQLENGGTYTLDCSLPVDSKKDYFPTEIPESFGVLSVEDAVGASQELYFGGMLPDDFQRSLQLPPLPFGGIFDARLTNGARLTEDEVAVLQVQTSQYPITIELTRLPESEATIYLLEEFVGNQLVSARSITPGVPLQVINEELTRLRVRAR